MWGTCWWLCVQIKRKQFDTCHRIRLEWSGEFWWVNYLFIYSSRISNAFCARTSYTHSHCQWEHGSKVNWNCAQIVCDSVIIKCKSEFKLNAESLHNLSITRNPSQHLDGNVEMASTLWLGLLLCVCVCWIKVGQTFCNGRSWSQFRATYWTKLQLAGRHTAEINA